MDLRLAVFYGKLWALSLLDSSDTNNVRFKIDMSKFDDATRVLLAPPHQSKVYPIKDHWIVSIEDDFHVYTNSSKHERELTLEIHEDGDQAYAFVTENGELIHPSCLIFWNKKNLRVSNPGYGVGRFNAGVRVI